MTSYKQRLIISDYRYDLYPLFVDGRHMQSTHSEFHLSFCFVGGGTLENGVGLGLISIVRTLLFNALFEFLQYIEILFFNVGL